VTPPPQHRRAVLSVAELEPREVPSVAPPTVAEQVFLERLNDVRAHPAEYGRSIGVDLSYIPASPPLAFDPRLIAAALAHSQDMNAKGYFGHTGSNGSTPTQRISGAGYPWRGWGESVIAGYSTPEAALKALIIDAGQPGFPHRNQLLGYGTYNQPLRDVGIGIVQNGTGPLHNYYTLDFGYTTDTRPSLTGVVYKDLNHNGKYDAGEGVSGATVRAGAYTTTTWATGGFSLRVTPGAYTVSASGGGLPGITYRLTTVSTDNMDLDFSVPFTPTTPTPTPTPKPPPVPTTVNHAPTLAAVSNRTIRANTSLTVYLSGTDVDSNPLTYLASVQSQAYTMDQKYGFYYAGSYFTNHWGRGEKWFRGSGGVWYFIEPDGEVWKVGAASSTTYVARLQTAYYADPSKLINATRGGRVAVSGNRLTITPDVGFVGNLTVTAAVRDSHGSTATRSFVVTVV
jgi:uncharacterized protein YkwD